MAPEAAGRFIPRTLWEAQQCEGNDLAWVAIVI